MILRSLVLVGLLLSCTAHAKLFRNAYVSFELPPNWNCRLEGSEWVCENDFASKTKEAIIILTAKEVGPSDTLPAYLAHLQTPRTITGRGGMPTKSQIIHTKERMIGNHMWVDGMHLGSEIGPYFTRYLSTIKDRIAILVTFSAHKQHYTKYSGDFIRAVESLRVVATKDTLANRGGGADMPGGRGQVGVGPGAISDFSNELPGEAPARGGSKYLNLFLLALIAAGVGGFLYLRASKKPSSKKSSSSTKGKKK